MLFNSGKSWQHGQEVRAVENDCWKYGIDTGELLWLFSSDGTFKNLKLNEKKYQAISFARVNTRATEILKCKSVRSTDDVIDVIRTCVRQSQIATKTNDLSFLSKNISEIDYFSNTL